MLSESILIVAYHFPPVAGSSGLHRMVSLSRELLQAGYRVHVLSVSLNCYPRVEEANLAQLPDGVRVHRVGAFDSVKLCSIAGKYPSFLKIPDNFQSWIVTGVWQGLRLVRRERIKWVLSTYPIASAHCVGYFIGRWSSARWIADFRDPMAQPDYPTLPLQRRAFVWIERRAVAHASLLTFATSGALDYYRGNYPELSSERCLAINNGYDECLFTGLETGPGTSRQKLLLHSGALYPSERDPTQLFEALAALKAPLLARGYRVRLRATGHDDFVTGQIARFGLDGLVELAPLVSNREALQEMARAYGLLVLQAANCNDQIPAKIYEYLRSQRAIACFAHPAGATYRALDGQPGCWCAPLDDSGAIQATLREICLENDLSDYSRELDSVVGFERGAQLRPLIEWLESNQQQKP